MLGKPLPAFPKKLLSNICKVLWSTPITPQTEGFGFLNLNNQDCLCNIAVVAQSVRSEQKQVYIKISHYSILE